MHNNILLTETEYEILQKIWKLNRKVTSKELLGIFNEEGKNWKIQTLNTFLSKLAEEGYLKIGLESRSYLYWPAIDEVLFAKKNAEKILSDMYGGSLERFLSALAGGRKMSQKQKNDLEDWVNGWN
ncbi:MAG TPA: BlaI/MecI/CopY family transcriptional regulator [Candidatus Caccomorpha excrementavium]|nr:BlaI/MecI/CopY family transcriptional regulator [Candidatus Caccomorpha excrementavium]